MRYGNPLKNLIDSNIQKAYKVKQCFITLKILKLTYQRFKWYGINIKLLFQSSQRNEISMIWQKKHSIILTLSPVSVAQLLFKTALLTVRNEVTVTLCKINVIPIWLNFSPNPSLYRPFLNPSLDFPKPPATEEHVQWVLGVHPVQSYMVESLHYYTGPFYQLH